jgi:hypothetical protein
LRSNRHIQKKFKGFWKNWIQLPQQKGSGMAVEATNPVPLWRFVATGRLPKAKNFFIYAKRSMFSISIFCPKSPGRGLID